MQSLTRETQPETRICNSPLLRAVTHHGDAAHTTTWHGLERDGMRQGRCGKKRTKKRTYYAFWHALREGNFVIGGLPLDCGVMQHEVLRGACWQEDWRAPLPCSWPGTCTRKV